MKTVTLVFGAFISACAVMVGVILSQELEPVDGIISERVLTYNYEVALRKTIKSLILKNGVKSPKILRDWNSAAIKRLEKALSDGEDKYGIPAIVALSFLNHESGMYLYATGKNYDKSKTYIKSYDYGLAQINSIHLTGEEDIYSIESNLKLFFREYSRCSKRYGLFTDRSIVCYNYPVLAKKGSDHRVNVYAYNKAVRESYGKITRIYSVVVDSLINKVS